MNQARPVIAAPILAEPLESEAPSPEAAVRGAVAKTAMLRGLRTRSPAIPFDHAPAAPRAWPELSHLYFAIEAARTGSRTLIVQFVGSTGGEGVSTVAAGFASQAARDPEEQVLLVVCGARDRENGLDLPIASLLDLFQAGLPLDGAVSPYPGVASGSNVRWARLGPGAEDTMDFRMLSGFANELRRSFNVVVFDCPPVAGSALAGVLARVADGTVLVVAAGRTRRRELERTVAEIGRMGGQIVGAVMNRQRDWLPAWVRRRLG